MYRSHPDGGPDAKKKGWCLSLKFVTIQHGFTGMQEFLALVKAGWMRFLSAVTRASRIGLYSASKVTEPRRDLKSKCREATVALAQTGRLVQAPRRSARRLNQPPDRAVSPLAVGAASPP